MGKLTGRVAVITGASAGMGKQVARKFAEEGAKLAICARHMDKLQETVKICEAAGAEVLACTCDVTKYEDLEKFVQATVDRFGAIDILYNNAMSFSGYLKPITEHTRADWDAFYESGLIQVFHIMQLCFPYLKESKFGGKVICIGSGAGIEGNDGMVAYAAIKEAVRAMVHVAAVEWGKYNINVNCLNPGAVTEAIWDAMKDWPEEERDPIKMGYNPTIIGRFGDPYEDIAPVAVFLASDDARHLTGQTIMAEGGVTLS